jgi:hypothetical protein
MPTLKALAWPYSAISGLNQSPNSTEDAQACLEALAQSRLATRLANSVSGDSADSKLISQVVAYRRAALEIGTRANLEALERIYPSLGREFGAKFLRAQQMIVNGWQQDNRELFLSGQALNSAWQDWYLPRSDEIQRALRGGTR